MLLWGRLCLNGCFIGCQIVRSIVDCFSCSLNLHCHPLPLLSFPPPPVLSHISYPLFSSIQPKPKEDEAAKRKKTDEPSPDDPQPKEKEKEKEAEGGEEGEEEEKEKQPSPQPEESFIAEDEEVIIPV